MDQRPSGSRVIPRALTAGVPTMLQILSTAEHLGLAMPVCTYSRKQYLIVRRRHDHEPERHRGVRPDA